MQGLKVPEPNCARESKPSFLVGTLQRLAQRIDRLDDLVAELRGTNNPTGVDGSPATKAPPPCFELAYNTAPKMIEDFSARIENITVSLREMLI